MHTSHHLFGAVGPIVKAFLFARATNGGQEGGRGGARGGMVRDTDLCFDI